MGKGRTTFMSRHHIICRSRRGPDSGFNIAIIDADKHRNFHLVFDNKTPDEILEYLSEYFWKNKYGENGDRFIRRFLMNRKS